MKEAPHTSGVFASTLVVCISDSSGEESAFHDGLAMIEIEDKAIPPRKGFIDKNGKLVIPARFTYVYPFTEGLAAATESESGDTGWGYIDSLGNWRIPPLFDWASSFQFGLARVNRKKDSGYIDKKGDRILVCLHPADSRTAPQLGAISRP